MAAQYYGPNDAEGTDPLLFDLDGVWGAEGITSSDGYLANDLVDHADISFGLGSFADSYSSSAPDLLLNHTFSLPLHMNNPDRTGQQWDDLFTQEPMYQSMPTSFALNPFDIGPAGNHHPGTQQHPQHLPLSSPVNIPRHVPHFVPDLLLSPTDTTYMNSWGSSIDLSVTRTESVATSVASFDTAVETPVRLATEAVAHTSDALGTTPISVINHQPRSRSNRLVAAGGRRSRGRNRPLNPAQRTATAIMRKLKACRSCHDRKAKCDPGYPCKQCITYHRGNLIHNPCRDRRLEDLADTLLRGDIFPRRRTLGKDFGANFHAEDEVFPILLRLGFGEPLEWQARTVSPYALVKFPKELEHDHVVYNRPCDHTYPTERIYRREYVFPAFLTDVSELKPAIDEHLSKLVDKPANFVHFPFFRSPLEVLQPVWDFYLKLGELSDEKPAKQLLRQAFKLLLLIQIGGDTRIATSAGSRHVLEKFFSPQVHESNTVPCFIRGQVGEIYGELARDYMKEVLRKLELECLNKNCRRFPLLVSTWLVLLMATESIQYHTHKVTFHHAYDNVNQPHILSSDEIEGMVDLLEFYKNTFADCHRDRLLATSSTTHSWTSRSVGSAFVAGEDLLERLRQAVLNAKAYLVTRSRESLESRGGDITVFFDRLLARLLLLES